MKERSLEQYIGSGRLIPAKGGVFEVTVNGELIFSKKELHRHAEEGEVVEAIRRKLDQVGAAPPAPADDSLES